MNFPTNFVKSDDIDFSGKDNWYLIWECTTAVCISSTLGVTIFGNEFFNTGFVSIWNSLIGTAAVLGLRTNAFKKHWFIIIASFAFLFILNMLGSAYHVYSNPGLDYFPQISIWWIISMWLIMTYKLIRKSHPSKVQ